MLKRSIWHGYYIYVLKIRSWRYIQESLEQNIWKVVLKTVEKCQCVECIYKEDRGKCKKQEGRFLAPIFVTGWVSPWAMVRLEVLGQLENPVT
jgi:hypothetical protein